MIYCINPLCINRENSNDQTVCSACGTPLTIHDRIQLIKPIRELKNNFFSYTDIFEVTDSRTKWNPGPKQRIMKVLKWSDPKLVQLFERESLALQIIQSQSIPKSTIDDFFKLTLHNGETSIDLHCLIMDKIEGVNLYEWVETNGELPEKLAMSWLRQLVEIIDRVHQSEFFHRDIKPSNIICQPNGKLALIDFGASRKITDTYMTKIKVNAGASDTFTDTSKYEITVVSTPCYTPIEQINGRAIPQSDFYALGRTFVYLLTATALNQLPIDKKTGRTIWKNKANQINKLFANLIDELQSELPNKRPQTTDIILERLNRLPLQSKIDKITKSKYFKIIGFFTTALIFFFGYQLSKPLISRFYFDLASRNIENPKLAKKYYQTAIDYNPTDVNAYNNLALVCYQLLDFKCVQNSYQTALRLDSNSWSTYYNLGSFYDDQRQYKKAQQQYKIALEKSNNNSVEAINNLSRLNNIFGNYKSAESLALKGLNKPSNKNIYATLNKNLAWAFYGQGKYLQAQNRLQKALQFDPQKTEAYCLLAQTQEKLDLNLQAKLSWETCLILPSNLPEVQAWKQTILQKILPNTTQ
ncbi:MAG: tetratricopeptide repeat protein [Cyanobacteria bacterium P01_A01_bin.68]